MLPLLIVYFNAKQSGLWYTIHLSGTAFTEAVQGKGPVMTIEGSKLVFVQETMIILLLIDSLLVLQGHHVFYFLCTNAKID